MPSITTNHLTISGAYGRDYKSAKSAIEDFLAGKDFHMRSIGHGFGTYCTIRDFQSDLEVGIRYCNDMKICTVKVP